MEEKDKTIHDLEQEVSRLRDANKKLEETVQWMHDLIWKLVREREEQKTAEEGADSVSSGTKKDLQKETGEYTCQN